MKSSMTGSSHTEMIINHARFSRSAAADGTGYLTIKKLLLVLSFTMILSLAFGQVMHLGAMSEMGKTGFSSTISLDSLQKYKHLIATGPLGKMEGEITVLNEKKSS